MAAIDVALIMPALFLCAQKRRGAGEAGVGREEGQPQRESGKERGGKQTDKME